MKRPTILVSNDDGYLARGVVDLADALDAWATTVVVAPERERSAVGHSISLHKPLRLHQWDERRYWCSGSPTDAIYLAIHHLLDEPPDLVVSGVNRGYNLADDILYSGTVGAAIEGLLHHIPSIAVSVDAAKQNTFVPAAQLASNIAEKVYTKGLPERTMLNINVPSNWRDGDMVQTSSLGSRDYLREVTRNVDPRGREYFWLGGPRLGHFDHPGSDCNLVDDGIASVTPIELRMTATGFMSELRDWLASE